MNSFKMKFAVIVGVTQMGLGVVLKGFNTYYFRKKNPFDFFCEFIPQLLFLFGYFGYMVVMIFIKWGTDWTFVENQAPSIINLLINIFLNVGEIGDVPLYGSGSFQAFVQIFILCKYMNSQHSL
jgi:V-type H+-transporting ATPase subunit a